MREFTFIWNEVGSLPQRLAHGMRRVSIGFGPHRRPDVMTLWHSDGIGLRIYPVMHDVRERLEVGVLKFSTVSEVDQRDQMIHLPACFNTVLTVSKLVLNEPGVTAESGFALAGNDDCEILVVAGAYPCTLAIRGVLSKPHIFEPEYSIEAYTRAVIN